MAACAGVKTALYSYSIAFAGLGMNIRPVRSDVRDMNRAAGTAVSVGGFSRPDEVVES